MRVKNFNDKVLQRCTTRISPFNGSIFGPKAIDRILFNMPSETGMEVDMDTLQFHFTANLYTGANGDATNTDIYFLNSIESIIQSLRIRKGTSFLLEDLQRYNYLDSMFMNFVSDDFNNCSGKAQMGIGTAFQRKRLHSDYNTVNANTTLKSRAYAIPLRLSGISNYSGLVSTSLIDPVTAFQFEIELAPAADAIMAYRNDAVGNVGLQVTTAYYEISEVYMTYDTVRMAPEYHASLQRSISAGQPLQIPYKTWRTSIYSLKNTDQSVVFNINDTVKSLNAVFVSFFKIEEQGKFNIAGKDRRHFPNLKQAQLQLGSFYYPLQPIDCRNGASQAYLELTKAMGLAFVNGEYTGPYGWNGFEYATEKYGCVQNVQGAAGGFAAGTPEVINVNGVDTTAAYPVNGISLETYDANGYIRKQIGGAGSNLVVETTGVRYARECLAESPTQFMLGFNLRKVLDIVEGEVAGVDLQSSGSGLMSLRLDFDGQCGFNYNVIIASLYDAVLEIQGNNQTFRVE